MVYMLISVEYQLERPKRLIIITSLIISAISLLPVNLCVSVSVYKYLI